MKFSKRARYVLRMMLVFARQSTENGRVSLAEVARLTDMPKRYMEQLAIALKNASLIEGVTGKGGGYRLTRPAAKIQIGDIIEAAIGPVRIVECLDRPDLCMRSTDCECLLLYDAINQRITDVLYEFSLADLAGKGWARKISAVTNPKSRRTKSASKNKLK
ncbi:MAG TPA: Rrf2 family transcriptional regulator [Myxococcota bacterium]|nr:Rrf2 family transcriptional regulator [Myxococcota bacterium]